MKIDKLTEHLRKDEYGNCYGTYYPSNHEIMDKINEIIDYINEHEETCSKLYKTVGTSKLEENND